MIYVPLKQVAIAVGKYGPHNREVIRIARTMAEKLDKGQNEDFSGRLNGLEDTTGTYGTRALDQRTGLTL